MELNDFLIDGKTFNKILCISTSTRQRMKVDGRISPPDVPGRNGSGDKWLMSTAQHDLANLCQADITSTAEWSN